MAEHQLRPPRTQHVAVVDRVGTQLHRMHERQHLPPRTRRARPARQVDRLVDQRLDPQPARQTRRKQQPRIRDRPLVVELHPESVQHPTRPTMHHMSDLLTPGRGCHYSHYKALLRRSF